MPKLNRILAYNRYKNITHSNSFENTEFPKGSSSFWNNALKEAKKNKKAKKAKKIKKDKEVKISKKSNYDPDSYIFSDRYLNSLIYGEDNIWYDE